MIILKFKFLCICFFVLFRICVLEINFDGIIVIYRKSWVIVVFIVVVVKVVIGRKIVVCGDCICKVKIVFLNL